MGSEEDLDDDSRLTRDVYAHFGVAIYLAQVLEKGVLTCVVLADVIAAGVDRAEELGAVWDPLWAKHERLPLGSLLKEFRRAATPDEGLLAELGEALRKRNHLAHYYFWDHAADVFSVPGRKAMIRELLETHEKFEALNERVTAVTVEMTVRAGGTPEQLARAVRAQQAAMKEQVRIRDGDLGASDA